MDLPDVEDFSQYLKSSLDTDIMQMMDMVPESSDSFQDTMDEIAQESESRTYQPATGKDTANILQEEIRLQSLRNKQKLYRDQLKYLETSQGRSDYMGRIKEQQAKEIEERVNNIREDISNLDTVEEVQEYRDQLSENESQMVKDALDAREQELKTREKEQPTAQPTPA